MDMCEVKNLIKMLFTIPYIDKNEKNDLCALCTYMCPLLV